VFSGPRSGIAGSLGAVGSWSSSARPWAERGDNPGEAGVSRDPGDHRWVRSRQCASSRPGSGVHLARFVPLWLRGWLRNRSSACSQIPCLVCTSPRGRGSIDTSSRGGGRPTAARGRRRGRICRCGDNSARDPLLSSRGRSTTPSTVAGLMLWAVRRGARLVMSTASWCGVAGARCTPSGGGQSRSIGWTCVVGRGCWWCARARSTAGVSPRRCGVSWWARIVPGAPCVVGVARSCGWWRSSRPSRRRTFVRVRVGHRGGLAGHHTPTGPRKLPSISTALNWPAPSARGPLTTDIGHAITIAVGKDDTLHRRTSSAATTAQFC
jgi:hypothetical protein